MLVTIAKVNLFVDGRKKGRCTNIIAFCCHRCACVLHTVEWSGWSLARFVLYKTVCHIVHFVMRCDSHADTCFTHHDSPEEISCLAQEGCPQAKDLLMIYVSLRVVFVGLLLVYVIGIYVSSVLHLYYTEFGGDPVDTNPFVCICFLGGSVSCVVCW